MKKQEIITLLESKKYRSAWDRGVNDYATELLEGLKDSQELTKENAKTILLNGADNWSEYSWGGCSLIYNKDIAKRLCSPSELKKTKHGERKPNRNEEWLDCQTRALFQAYNRIRKLL